MADLSVRELPLFPLPDVVLFPSDVLPLHIFESRYRMMLQSVLETDRRFGVVRWDPRSQSMASIGCCAEVIQHQTGEDGRSNIVTLGQQRFRVLNVTRDTPFRSAMVSWIEDDPVEDMTSLHSLTESVASALKDVVELTGKLTDSPTALPDDLPDLPRELSFWIGAHLGGPVADQQQELLELTSTRSRLEQEFSMLDETRRQLAARTVLRDTLSSSNSDDG
ncbi:ATP-dependent protease [Synechococcus sp. PROS-7-1]|uniref:LON peptidase substrate-binding domain-containing protein n=1 Tax=Synechococcus sp. PROS-7-1 TaxID=1442556 RepID=UPI0016470907|nr:LON peptidase substrate-binding domain-containing protein [Synechococcus sp. PROS-7-1]MBL6798267.1 LON peptidase substrate-binding domain-containing protein [Synechococcus sp. BS307-5m-G39]MBL6800544.1 LON peptidase substrate-binding domain-containing protein [Synechococcus sp. BS307-5m-G37]QNI84293.1 ATP-dependent protease [Synechococcus sp. PROS-7-1]